jgi:hypothetical protein
MANTLAIESGLKRAHGAVLTQALTRHGRVLQAELLGKPATVAGRKCLEPFFSS